MPSLKVLSLQVRYRITRAFRQVNLVYLIGTVQQVNYNESINN